MSEGRSPQPSEVVQDLIQALSVARFRGRRYSAAGTAGGRDGSVAVIIKVDEPDGAEHMMEIEVRDLRR